MTNDRAMFGYASKRADIVAERAVRGETRVTDRVPGSVRRDPFGDDGLIGQLPHLSPQRQQARWRELGEHQTDDPVGPVDPEVGVEVAAPAIMAGCTGQTATSPP